MNETAARAPAPAAPPAVRRIALAGNPNVGKTTIFNALTGLRQKVANYPGVTVERKTGRLVGREAVEVVDLPGTYSLSPKSVDERVAFEVLTGRMDGEAAPDLVVCVLDATNLERNLYLATQVMDLGLPVVVALNMMDAARTAGLRVDADALSKALGVPVVALAARQHEGLDALRDALRRPPVAPGPGPAWTLMPAVASAVERLADALAALRPDMGARRRWTEALGALTNDALLDKWEGESPALHAAVVAERADLDAARVPYRQAEMMGRYGWLGPLVAAAVTRDADVQARTTSDRIDAVVTHRVAGPLLFLGLLALIFQAVFTWAAPLQDLIERGVAGAGGGLRGILPEGLLTDVLIEGALTGVGNVLVFLPQILLLFFFLGLMEDTGYLARSAFIMDRIMRKLGLSGGSVVPLLSSFACAIPGIMAARTLPNERDRLITIMVAPLMACSARLPVYVLFIGAFIPTGAFFGVFGYQGAAMFFLYLLGTLMAFAAAWVLKKLVFKGDASMFVMELPPYRLPQWRAVVWRMVERSKLFVLRAGKIILGLSIILWFLASFPRTADTPDVSPGVDVARAPQVSVDRNDDDSLASGGGRAAARQVEFSYIGRLGHAIEPLMRPLGFDWKISAAIVTSFAAREVIVSSLATIYAAENADEASPLLRDALRRDRYPDGRPVYTPLVAASLLVFYVFALQCMSTLAIARRETGTWKWPAVMWLYMMALAYGFAFVTFQGGRLLGLG